MILRIASSRIVGQGDIVGRSGYFSLNLSANSVMRGRLDARRTLKSLVADLRKDTDRCIELVQKELRNLREQPLTTSRLNAAKKQIIGQIGVASDNFESNALDMAKSFLHYKQYEAKEKLFQRIESLTASYLQDIANEMFDENYLSTLIYQ